MIKTDKGYFVKTDKEFINSFFENKKSPLGFYKKTKNCIKFFDMQNKPIFYIARNKWKEIISGNLSKFEGKFFYSCGMNEEIEFNYITENESYCYQKELIKDIFRTEFKHFFN
jgi:hypothetical protein